METSTQAESSRDGWKRTREADRLLLDVRENVGEPSSRCRQRRSCERYTIYMALHGELFVSQGKYANEILRRFHMEKCKPMQTPLVGNWRKEDATQVR